MQAKTITRIQVVDSLRGFALMGLFLVHMVSFLMYLVAEYFKQYPIQQSP